MNGISNTAEPVYRTCFCYDSSTKTFTQRTYNYTEMLEKAASATLPEGVKYWEPDEYGRVFIDPKHPMHATLEAAEPVSIQLPAAGSAGLPPLQSKKAEEQQKARKEENQKAQEDQIRLLREEWERTARQEALLRRLVMSRLASERV